MRYVDLITEGKVVGQEAVYNFREIEDLEKFPAYRGNVHIELDHCPFCGNTAVLNRDTHVWFGNCMICGSQGPSHWDWRKAGMMWNDRSLKTIAECKEMNFENWDGFDFSRILPEQREKAGIKIDENGKLI